MTNLFVATFSGCGLDSGKERGQLCPRILSRALKFARTWLSALLNRLAFAGVFGEIIAGDRAPPD
jgi:hypothetical protein